MLYFFSGNNTRLLEKNIHKWISQFEAKYGKENLMRVQELKQIGEHFLIDEIETSGLFAEKKLIVFHELPLAAGVKDWEIIQKQERILASIQKKSDTTIVLFYAKNPDKRGKLYKYLIKNATSYIYEYKNDQDKIQDLLNQFWESIDFHTATYLLQIKWWNIDKAFQELKKLSIIYPKINKSIIDECIVKEWEESIFFVLDLILSKKTRQAVLEIQNILKFQQVIPFYYGLISNLRTIVYIQLLEKKWHTKQKITDILKLWNRGFLIGKRYAMSQDEIRELFIKLLELDRKLKQWELSYLWKEALQEAIILSLIIQK